MGGAAVWAAPASGWVPRTLRSPSSPQHFLPLGSAGGGCGSRLAPGRRWRLLPHLATPPARASISPLVCPLRPAALLPGCCGRHHRPRVPHCRLRVPMGAPPLEVPPAPFQTPCCPGALSAPALRSAPSRTAASRPKDNAPVPLWMRLLELRCQAPTAPAHVCPRHPSDCVAPGPAPAFPCSFPAADRPGRVRPVLKNERALGPSCPPHRALTFPLGGRRATEKTLRFQQTKPPRAAGPEFCGRVAARAEQGRSRARCRVPCDGGEIPGQRGEGGRGTGTG